MRRLQTIVAPIVLTAILLAIWETACRLLAVPTFLLPAPSEVARATADNLPLLLTSAWNTLAVAVIAWVLASLCAGGIALVVSLSDLLEDAVRPLAVMLQVTPIVALAPLVNIWAGLDHPERGVIALAVVVAFFPIFSGVLTGLKAVDPDLERLFDLYDAGRVQRLFRLRLPAALPYILQGHKVAAGLALVGAVVAEFVAGSGGSEGLAWRIMEAEHRNQTAKMMAALVVLAILAVALYSALETAERTILRRWRGR